MKNPLKTLSTLVGLALAGAIAHAQSAPMVVHYQGRLTQANGLPLTTPTASVAFEIFPSASGGTRLWPSPAEPLSTYTVILRNGGIFSVMLGDTSIPGMPALTQSVFQQGVVYLQISIAGNPVGPRQPIVSVPWSILSDRANTVVDGAITTPKLADGAVTSAKIQDNTVGAGDLALDRTSLAKVSEGKLYFDAPGNGLYGVVPYTVFGDPNQVSYLDVVGNSSNLRIRGNYPSLEINRIGYGNAWVWGQRADVGGSNDDLKLLRYANGNYSGIPLQVNLLSGFVSLNGASALDPLTIRTSPGAYEQGLAIRNNAETQSFRFGYFNGGLDIAAFPTSGVSPVLWLGANNNVGIATNAPSARLHINPGSGTANIKLANSEISDNHDGILRVNAGGSVVQFGDDDQVVFKGGIEVKSGFPFIDFGGGDYDVRQVNDSAGRMSFYKGSGGYADVYARIFNQSSSRRWKDSIKPIADPLGLIDSLQGVRFRWIPRFGGTADIGFIAEDVGKVLPEVVSYERNGKDAIGLDYGRLTAVLVEAVKAQNGSIESLTRENERLRRQNAGFEARLRALESKAAR